MKHDLASDGFSEFDQELLLKQLHVVNSRLDTEWSYQGEGHTATLVLEKKSSSEKHVVQPHFGHLSSSPMLPSSQLATPPLEWPIRIMALLELLKKAGLLESDVSVESMYSNWLLGYSSLLGPIAGIMMVDYFLIKNQNLDLVSLYKEGGEYPMVNWAGFIAFGVPVVLTIIAITTGFMSWFYDYGWFTGAISGAIVYYFAARALQPQGQPAAAQ